MSNKLSRRSFLRASAASLAAFTVIPNYAMGSVLGHKAPSDKLNIVGVGVGGQGRGNLRQMQTENIIGLCDVDWKYATRCFEQYPNAKKYWDWRKMFDEMGKDIDAVLVATADHSHAIIAAHAMTMSKHVTVQKPLTHTVYESRLLTKLADKYKVATQMGNQGSSGEGVRQICEWIWNGEIGDVTKVEAFTDRPIWPQGLNTPANGMWVPETLNWDLFTGPAKMRPFNEVYHPWNWRGWWDYGTGALGDMACHIMHPIFKSLKLGYPTKVQGTSTLLLKDCAPHAQSVRLVFPARANTEKKVKFPEVEVTWTDGGIRPKMPEGWPVGKDMNNAGGGVIFHGTKDKLICGCYGREPWLLSGRVPNAPKRVREVPDNNHYQDWIRACKESPENRIQPASPFSEAGPFNEMVVMGVLAVRLQLLNKELLWDGPNMKFTNISDEDKFGLTISDDFKIEDGHPSFNKTKEEIFAKPFAEELIKHTYREGWSLPPMPV